MKTYAVVFTPEATEQLVSLYEYIATHGSPTAAANYTEAIVAYCEGLSTFPHRGTRRDDIRPGLRITNYRRRAVIAFEVDDSAEMVSVLGVFYVDAITSAPSAASRIRTTTPTDVALEAG